MSHVTCHVSPVTCYLTPITYHFSPALTCLLSMLGKTAFILKPLEARRKKTFGYAAVGGFGDRVKSMYIWELCPQVNRLLCLLTNQAAVFLH